MVGVRENGKFGENIMEKTKSNQETHTFITDPFVESVNKRAPDSFKVLYVRLAESLVRFSSKFVKNRADAEDVVQDVIVELWLGNAKFLNENQLRAYLYKAVKNRTISVLKRKRRFVYSLTELENRCTNDQSRNFFDINYEIFSLFDNSLCQLPKECKKIFSLLLEGFSSVEIAFREKCAASTVRAQKRRGISIIKSFFFKKHKFGEIAGLGY